MAKILAIDDKRDNLITIKALLKHLKPDFEVITALSGREGYEKAKLEKPDTIILDIIMPEMDGYETCNLLKKDPATKYIPILMLTAIKTDTASRIKGLSHGADAFFTKPIDPYELSAQLEVLLRIKKSEDLLRTEKQNLINSVDAKTRELLEHEVVLNQIFNGFPIPAFMINPEHKVILWNRALEKLSGIEADKILGTSDQWKMLSNNPMPLLADMLLDEIKEEELEEKYPGKWHKSSVMQNALELETAIIDLKGNERYLFLTAVLIKDDEGKVEGALETIQDITLLKENEKELEKHRVNLEEIVQERTRQLEDKNEELQRLNNLFSGREFRIKELRDEVKKLKKQLSDQG